MKNLSLIFLLVLAWFGANGQAHEWIKQYPTIMFAEDAGNEVSVDSDGNSLVFSAFFNDSIRIGNQLYLHNSGTWPNLTFNGYIVKYDLSGSILWSKQIGGADIGNVNVQIDGAQNIVIAGYYKDSLILDGTLFSAPGYSVFIAKLDPAGKLIWARTSSAPASIPLIMRAQSRWVKFDIDQIGNIFVTGSYYGSVTFGNSSINTMSLGSLNYLANYLLKYDSNGNLQWLNNFTDVNGIGNSMAVSDQGDIFYATINFSTNGTIKKFNQNGILQWTKNIPRSSAGAFTHALGTDKKGSAYIASGYDKPIALGPFNLPINSSIPFVPKYYVAKISNSGNWKWVKEINADLTTSIATIKMPKKIEKDFYLAGQFTGTLSLGDSIFTQGPTFVAKFDTLGTLMQSRRFLTSNGYYSTIEALTMDKSGNAYFSGGYDNNIRIGQFKLTSGGSKKRYLTKLRNFTNTVTGTVFQDTNGNGIKDSGELPFANRLLEITPGPIYVNTLNNGNYGTYLPAGTFNITLPNPPRHYTVAPSNYNILLTGQNQMVSGKDFAVQPIPNSPDAKINITPYSIASPGGTLVYFLTYTNVGTTVLTDSITLNFNAAILTYDSASLTPAIQKTGALSWFYQNLQPNEARNIRVYLTVDSAAVLGTSLMATAVVKPLLTDLFVQDNYDTLNQIITRNPFNPNRKQVNHNFITPSQLATQPYLDYIIYFKNPGNTPVNTVIIRDEISSNLNLTSLEILSASHPYSFQLLNNGLAEWRFDNINLPDSTRNATASHGFIRYRIQPKASLNIGDEIKSRAFITFDFKQPVMTSYAITRIGLSTGTKEPKAKLQPFQLYPNPARNHVMVAAELKKPSAATVRLVNVLGQVISEVTLSANNQIHYQLPLNNLPKGVYLVQLETENGRQMQRLVVQ